MSVDLVEQPRPRARLAAVDWLRGLVMVLMVLDHVREFFGMAGVDPTNLSQTTPALFFTRWVTHFCAPVFVFLAGVGAALWRDRAERSKGELARFLAVRGLWLVVAEIVLVHWGMTFDWTFRFIPLTVVWAIGMGLLTLAPLVLVLPRSAIGAIGIILIVGHNALDGFRPAEGNLIAQAIWNILHQPGVVGVFGGTLVFAAYPLIPWVGVVWAGYAFGAIYKWEPARRRTLLIGLGLACSIAFVMLRYSNVYGDPRPWATQDDGVLTLLSFLNLQKYPPSLLYLLMTLGPALIALGLADGISADRGVSRWLVTLGRVPLFYYLLQWYLIHILAIVVNFAVGKPWAWLLTNGPFQSPPGHGYDLWVTYAMWALTMILLTWPSAWFGRYRARHPGGWRQYF